MSRRRSPKIDDVVTLIVVLMAMPAAIFLCAVMVMIIQALRRGIGA